VNGPLVLTLPKSGELSTQMGMRTRLEGTQASGAGESHTQEANVAEVSQGKPVNGEPENPESMNLPGGERFGNSRPSNAPDKQVTNGVGGNISTRGRRTPSTTKSPQVAGGQ